MAGRMIWFDSVSGLVRATAVFLVEKDSAMLSSILDMCSPN